MAEKGGGFQELERRIHEMEEQDRAAEVRGKEEEKEGAKRVGAARKEQGKEEK